MAKRSGKRAPKGRAKRKRSRRGFGSSVLIAAGVAVGLLAVLAVYQGNVRHVLDLRRDYSQANTRIHTLNTKIASDEAQAAALESDPVAIESAIRSELGLARPGEWVVREEDSTSLRNP
ncbi:MAG: septum formation initiator family protein [Deltaproteobacteria bacterium]|nr:septum formation initiator family protein [Deltaproteobacteria bacterium]